MKTLLQALYNFINIVNQIFLTICLSYYYFFVLWPFLVRWCNFKARTSIKPTFAPKRKKEVLVIFLIDLLKSPYFILFRNTDHKAKVIQARLMY